jgi:hypothetical protein
MSLNYSDKKKTGVLTPVLAISDLVPDLYAGATFSACIPFLPWVAS